MKKCTTFLLFILISIGAFAQIPDWAINLPKSNNPTMDYLVGIGEGNTYKNAYNEAVCDALRKLILRFGLSVNSNDVMSAVYSGQELATISRDYNIPPFKDVCISEVKQQGVERVYVLFQIPANAMITNPVFEPFTKCDNNSRNGNKYIAWNIAGTGYPWNLVSGIEFRYGGVIGGGAYLDFGADFTPITLNILSNYSYNNPTSGRVIIGTQKTTKIAFHYAAGLKFYIYKGVFVDFGYGTISKPSASVDCSADTYVSTFAGSLSGTDHIYGNYYDKAAVKRLVENSHGLLFHAGYNLVTNLQNGTGFFLGVSAGASYDVVDKIVAPSANIKIGVAWGVK